MVQPRGFQSEVNNSVVCRLKNSLYGLEQAPHAWNSMITHHSSKMGFSASKSDSSLFILKGLLCILLYVDDLVIIEPELAKIGSVKSQLLDTFEMKDLGVLPYFLGIEVIHTSDSILLSQQYYVLTLNPKP